MTTTMNTEKWNRSWHDEIDPDKITGDVRAESALLPFFARRKAEIEGIISMFKINDLQSVTGFLNEFPGLFIPLEQSVPAIRTQFGEADIELEVFKDPESGARQLLVRVKTSLPANEALSRLRRFDEAFTDNLAPAADSMIVFMSC